MNNITRRSAGGRRALQDQAISAKRTIFDPNYKPPKFDENARRVAEWLKEHKGVITSHFWHEVIEAHWTPDRKDLADYLESLCPECLSGEGSYNPNIQGSCTFCHDQ